MTRPVRVGWRSTRARRPRRPFLTRACPVSPGLCVVGSPGRPARTMGRRLQCSCSPLLNNALAPFFGPHCSAVRAAPTGGTGGTAVATPILPPAACEPRPLRRAVARLHPGLVVPWAIYMLFLSEKVAGWKGGRCKGCRTLGYVRGRQAISQGECGRAVPWPVRSGAHDAAAGCQQQRRRASAGWHHHQRASAHNTQYTIHDRISRS